MPPRSFKELSKGFCSLAPNPPKDHQPTQHILHGGEEDNKEGDEDVDHGPLPLDPALRSTGARAPDIAYFFTTL